MHPAMDSSATPSGEQHAPAPPLAHIPVPHSAVLDSAVSEADGSPDIEGFVVRALLNYAVSVVHREEVKFCDGEDPPNIERTSQIRKEIESKSFRRRDVLLVL